MSTFVLFIGGYKATIGDINLWTASAGGQKQDWIFDGYPWPPSATDKDKPADSGATSAVTAFRAAKSMPEAINKIVDGKYDEVYIVGHSSGCAIANKIDEELMVALGKSAPSMSTWWRSMASAPALRNSSGRPRKCGVRRTARTRTSRRTTRH